VGERDKRREAKILEAGAGAGGGECCVEQQLSEKSVAEPFDPSNR
jgi:hypothetical protein